MISLYESLSRRPRLEVVHVCQLNRVDSVASSFFDNILKASIILHSRLPFLTHKAYGGNRSFLQEMAVRNLDYIFTVSTLAIASSWLDILAKLEIQLDSRSSEPWSYRRLPTSTATFPVIINSEEEDKDSECFRVRANPTQSISKDQGTKDWTVFSRIKMLLIQLS